MKVPPILPMRRMTMLVDGILQWMLGEFDRRYARKGRLSVPPQRLLRALLQVQHSLRSERQLMEQLDYNLLFCRFVVLRIDDPGWDRTVICINRDQLLSGGAARDFFDRVLAMAEWKNLASAEHFSVDGSLVEAWASHKSFVRKDGSGPEKPAGRNPTVDFTGEKRSNANHESTTDRECRAVKGDTVLRVISQARNWDQTGPELRTPKAM